MIALLSSNFALTIKNPVKTKALLTYSEKEENLRRHHGVSGHRSFILKKEPYCNCVTVWVISGFPDCSVVKKLTCSAGDAEDPGLILGLGRSPGEGTGYPLQYSRLENPMDRRAWWASVCGVVKKTPLSTHTYYITRKICLLQKHSQGYGARWGGWGNKRNFLSNTDILSCNFFSSSENLATIEEKNS